LELFRENETSRVVQSGYRNGHPESEEEKSGSQDSLDHFLSSLQSKVGQKNTFRGSSGGTLCGMTIFDEWDQAAHAEGCGAEFCRDEDVQSSIRKHIENVKSMMAQYELHEKLQKALTHTKEVVSELERRNRVELEKCQRSKEQIQKADAELEHFHQSFISGKEIAHDASRIKPTNSSIQGHTDALDNQSRPAESRKWPDNMTIPKISNRSRWVAEFLRLNVPHSEAHLPIDSLVYSNTREGSTILLKKGSSVATPRRAIEQTQRRKALDEAILAGERAASQANSRRTTLKQEEEPAPGSISDLFLPADLFMSQAHSIPSELLFSTFGEATDDLISEIEDEQFMRKEEEEYPFDEYEDYELETYTDYFISKRDASTCSSTESCSCTDH